MKQILLRTTVTFNGRNFFIDPFYNRIECNLLIVIIQRIMSLFFFFKQYCLQKKYCTRKIMMVFTNVRAEKTNFENYQFIYQSTTVHFLKS